MNAGVAGCLAFGLAIAVLAGADFPQVEISNDALHAKVYLPDPERGYYRGTRFDWSGVIASLKYKGHDYFGPLFDQHDPKVHDNIRGPVEDFRTNNAGLGYDESKAGGTFIKIGVGVLRKAEEQRYRQANYYEIVNSGRWSSRKGRDWVEFVHELSDGKGYSYLYRKTVRLAKGKPELAKAGACAVGVGGELVGKPLIEAKDFAAITRNALDFMAIVREAKRK